ncbi:MAG: DUF6576 domain-containing protein [Acidimicrobiales bacterium]
MPRKFRSGGRSPLNPWFRVGEFDVTTTVLLIAATVLSYVLYAIDKAQFLHLFLWSDEIQHGEVWRIVTWPLVNRPSFWSLLTLVFLYIFARQVEAEMGRFKFAGLIGWITVVPAVLVTAFSMRPLSTAPIGDYSSISMISMGILVAFAAEFPGARFFFNIPSRVIAAVLVAFQLLGLIGDRFWHDVWLLLFVVVTSLVAMRAYGFATDLTFIPRLTWPFGKRRSGGGPRPSSSGGGGGGGKRKKRRGQPELKIVTPAYRPPVVDRGIQDEIDTLLDKIAAQGLDSLTSDERQRLDRASRRLRGED